jgi:hypothetical protein
MSTLQLGLAIAGGLLLAAVVAWNTWTSRRNAPMQADANPQDTVPLAPEGEATRQEPVFDAPIAPLPAPEKKPGLDPLIDVIAPIALEGPASGDAALAAMPPTRRAGSKPFAIEGLNSATQAWEVPMAGQRYSAFQAGVQLANRTGALNEIEYSEFVVKAQAFADAVNGAPEFPEMLDAARLGFVAGAMPGRMVLAARGAGLPPVLGLSFNAQAAMSEDPAQSAIRDVTLSLDVPQVDRSERPFVRLREAALALAEAMDGAVTDDNGQQIVRDAMDVIGAELETLYDTLDARDLSAGSPQARRLFS